MAYISQKSIIFLSSLQSPLNMLEHTINGLSP